MPDADLLTLLLRQLPGLLPTLVGLGIGLALAARHRARLGAAGRIALLGFGLLTLTTLASSLFFVAMQMLAMRQAIDLQLLRWIYPAASAGFAILTGAGFVLLGLALARGATPR
ncbi:hypothetical protein [Luteimonas deserti]|uniref:Uncharacterized protein n=1 Tax=Luteimonas deserti TaxID=2752306 RepID=A0A7Z0QNP6_9GAMM|nr:hypothetical protein [Luteimonas deserti]NYZ61201.1 hypothetical protein [Luteimonas deserti]